MTYIAEKPAVQKSERQLITIEFAQQFSFWKKWEFSSMQK
jgi:hypothetical protein